MVAVIKPYVLFFCVLLFGNALGAAKDDFYEDALAREREGDLAGAIIQLKNSVQSSPDFLPGWVRLSETYLQVANGGAAENAIKRAQILGADPEYTILPLAKAFLLQGKVDQLIALQAPPGFDRSIHAQLLIVQANALLETHRYDKARELYDKAATLAPDNVDHFLGRAMVEIRAGRSDVAAPFLDDALQLAPMSAKVWYINAELHRNLGDHETALLNFNEAIARRNGHGPALIGRAAILLDLGQTDDAAADLQEALAADPDNIQALHLNAALQRRIGNDAGADEALNAVREIIESLPTEVVLNHLPSLMVSATLAMRDGNFEQAKSNLEKYLNNFPGHHGARKMLVSVHMRLGTPANARPILLEMVDEAPDDPEIRFLLGNAFAAMGWHGKAVEAFEKSQALGLNTAAVHLAIGTSRLAIGDAEGALAAFEKADDGDAATRAKLMKYNLYLSTDDPVRALHVAESLVASDPANAAHHNRAASTKLILGYRDRARQQFEQAVALNPSYLVPRLNLAEMARQDGELDNSRVQYEDILATDSQSLGAMRGLAEIATMRHHFDVAIQWLNRVIAIDPDAVGDRIALVRLHLVENDISAAKEALRILRENHPLRLDVLLFSAQFKHRFSDIAGARDEFAGAVRVAQGSARSLTVIADHQLALGFDEDALRNLNRARVLNDSDRTVLAKIAHAKIRLGRLAEAHKHAEAIIEADPENTEGYAIRASASAKAGEHIAAIEDRRKILVMENKSSNLIQLAHTYVKAGQRDEAIRVAQTWLADNPSSAQVRAFVAQLLMDEGQNTAAIEEYEAVLAALPNELAANNNLAILYDRVADARAVSQARRVLSLNRTSPAVLDTVGWILSKHGFTNEGLSLLRQAQSRDASAPSIKYHLARVLLDQGEVLEPKRLLTDALSDPNFDNRLNAEKLLMELPGS